MSEKGRRLSVWIPEEDFWLFSELDRRVKKIEELGVMCSRGEIVRVILRKELGATDCTKKDEPKSDSGVSPTG